MCTRLCVCVHACVRACVHVHACHEVFLFSSCFFAHVRVG